MSEELKKAWADIERVCDVQVPADEMPIILTLRKAHSLIERAMSSFALLAELERDANKAGKELKRAPKYKAMRLHREAVELMRELSGLK